MNSFHEIPLEAIRLYMSAIELSWKGQHDLALKNLTTAVTVAPQFTAALCEMGQCYKKLRRYPEALSTYDRVLQSYPDHAEASLNRTWILEMMKEEKK
jgi:tetratricopeptide (TPR) repeat protein